MIIPTLTIPAANMLTAIGLARVVRILLDNGDLPKNAILKDGDGLALGAVVNGNFTPA